MQRVKVLVREGDSLKPEGFREQILWEDSGRFVVTSRLVGGRHGFDETMAFAASCEGEILSSGELSSDFGVLCVHQSVAMDAFASPYWE